MDSQNDKGIVGAALVVGAGIAGIQAALDLADSGYKVYLLESAPAIGGAMAQLDKTFPTNDCSMCILSPKVVECARHLNIELMTWSALESVSGQAGHFQVRVRHKPRFVQAETCTGCGECVTVCPVEVPSEFDEGLGRRKAIYRPYPQAVPNIMAIDKRGTAPCRAACPAGTSAQGYVALIAQGQYAEALAVSREANPFTSVCGRVCYHPCETACSRQMAGDGPVAIAALKRFMADWAAEHGDRRVERVPVTRPERVAIVGAGPCGLTAAHDLARLGYGVTVHEALPKAGGMLRYGIPDYRLPQAVLDAEIQRIADLGVEIRTNSPVRDLNALRGEYDAVLLSVGAHRATALRIEGEELDGVQSAIDFLRRVNAGERPALGRQVVVVGGGNTAVDAARCARRLGAEVTLVYRRSRSEMPAYAFEIEEAEAEGVELHELTNPVRILGRDGQVRGVELLRMRLGEPDASGRPRPIPVEGSEFEVEADAVILAIGQLPDLGFCGGAVDVTRLGSVAYDKETLVTSAPGVFAAGDAATGPRSAIEAIGMGHRAAESIHRYLTGEEAQFLPRIAPEEVVSLGRDEVAASLADGEVELRPRAQMAELPVEERLQSFAETALGLTEKQAIAEARRCLACGVCAECYRCLDACEPGAIDHRLESRYSDIEVGAIILATGFDEFDPRVRYELGYSRYKDVVTSIEFERILSASGPYEGHVARPSDGRTPRRIAFLQCVGSRDEQCGQGYCSSVCCMYAIKEAVIAQEHVPGLETSIYYMEMRAFGKDFDKYYERARDEHGVRFVRARVAKVEDGPDGQLRVLYQTDDEQHLSELYDMVVLSVGLEPSTGTRTLIERLGLRHTPEGFCHTPEFAPLCTSREGVYVCGAASGPKDIPETVIQASAAAAEVGKLLAPARASLTRAKEYPPEIDVSGVAPRVGVFVCHCGLNIAGTVDVEAVQEYAKRLPYVVYTGRNLFTCSQDTQEAIKDVIEEHGINRVVVSSCSPRTHEALFQETIRESGLNPYLFELANIRDQCSWVHMNQPEQATEKAKDLVRMAVSRVVEHRPLYGQPLPITHSALVVGGGVTGLTAALEMAGQGYPVHLVEREPQLGGNARHIRRTLAGEDVGEMLAGLIEAVQAHPLISVHTHTALVHVDGFVGNFKSTLRQQCHGSGPEELEMEHGVVIIASGAHERPTTAYLYGQDERVLTQRELEEALADDTLTLPSDRPASVVMIQCVESRTPEQPYCSRVCCSQALKNAIVLKERHPETEVYILYRDIRSYGLRERFYRRARQLGVIFMHYDLEPEPGHAGPPEVERIDGRLQVRIHDPVIGEQVTLEPDLLALSVGIAPHGDAQDLAALFKVPLNAEHFFLEAHMKLRPVEFATEGVYLAGLAHSPKFIDEAIAQAKAAVSRACTVLSQEQLTSPGSVAHVDPLCCVACGDCEAICPYAAIQITSKEVLRRVWRDVAEVNPALCKGCGLCTAACRSGCITLDGFHDVQIMAQITALMAE
ncbi:MAG: FAD-dependent oxidoreductase [Anaerolineae bacterium]|nr:FAD-dependent oxidoreductase [Anaerolineae bacterium]